MLVGIYSKAKLRGEGADRKGRNNWGHIILEHSVKEIMKY